MFVKTLSCISFQNQITYVVWLKYRHIAWQYDTFCCNLNSLSVVSHYERWVLKYRYRYSRLRWLDTSPECILNKHLYQLILYNWLMLRHEFNNSLTQSGSPYATLALIKWPVACGVGLIFFFVDTPGNEWITVWCIKRHTLDIWCRRRSLGDRKNRVYWFLTVEYSELI